MDSRSERFRFEARLAVLILFLLSMQRREGGASHMIGVGIAPVACGYFRSDKPETFRRREADREAGWLYMMHGRGVCRMGRYFFEARKGDFIALPKGAAESFDAPSSEMLAYRYAYFVEARPQSEWEWPWTLCFGAAGAVRENTLCVSAPCNSEIVSGFLRIEKEMSSDGTVAKLAACAQLALLGVAFARHWERQHGLRDDAGVRSRVAVPECVERVAAHIRKHFREDLKLARLAGLSHYSERRLMQLFQRHYEHSPMAYVRVCRVREAQRLLANKAFSIKEVARQLGFRDPQYFSRVFRKGTGLSPTEYVKGQGLEPQGASETSF